MRFKTLHAEQFGHFQRAQLTLPEGPSLVLVHGRNEAGKTTLLEAIRWLLFGGTPNKWAFDGNVSKLAVSGDVEFQNGVRVELRRSRGRGAGFRGTIASGDSVDEEWIKGKLGGASRGLFENVFGFSLDKLAEGAKALADENVKNAVYGGGLGSVQPDAILDDLEKHADELFRERGGSRIRASLDRIAELRTKVQASVTQTDAFLALEQDFAAREAAVHAQEKLVAELRAAETRARIRRDAFGPLSTIAAATAELSTLVVPEGLPADAAARHARASERRERLAEEADSLRERIRVAESTLAEVTVDEAILAAASKIDALVRGLERYRSGAAQHPRLLAELETMEARTREALGALRPSWELARLREFRVDVATRADLEHELAEHERIAGESTRVQEDIASIEGRLADANERLRALSAEQTVDVGPVRAWLEGWSGDLARRRELQKLDKQVRADESKRDAARKKLSPPLARDADPNVSLPRPEQVDALIVEREACVARLARGKEQVDALGRSLREVDARLSRLAAEADLPTERELLALRAERDRLWNELRANRDADPIAFERALRVADDAVDRMRRHANVVQQRAIDEIERARLLDERTAAETNVATEERALAALDESHRGLFAGLETVLGPRAMRGFLDDHARFLEAEAAWRESVAGRDALALELSAYEARGQALLASKVDVEELRVEAQRRVAREDGRAVELATLAQKIADDTRTLGQKRARARELARATDEWNARWPAQLARLGFPDDLAPRAVGRIVPALLELRERFSDHDRVRRDLDRLEKELAEFASAAHELGEGEPETVVRALESRLQTARTAERIRAEATRERDSKRKRLAEVEAALDVVEKDVAALRAAAGVDDDLSFQRVAAQRAHAERLRIEIDAARAGLARITGEVPGDEWSREVLAEGAAGLAHALERASEAATAADQELRARERAVGDAKARLGNVNGRADAAELEQEVEQTRASLAVDAERWAVLTVANKLLRAAIARFEREHQPAVLARASAIFGEMTLGAFTRVRKTSEGLLCEREDGREASTEQLSTGTREQLYLAIRLAYIDRYCRGAEPLPVILDDVLVNFDDTRARATLSALAAFGSTTQVLLFTCHESTLALARSAAIDAVPLEIPRSS